MDSPRDCMDAIKWPTAGVRYGSSTARSPYADDRVGHSQLLMATTGFRFGTGVAQETLAHRWTQRHLTTVDDVDVNSALRSLRALARSRVGGTESGSGDCGGGEFPPCHARTTEAPYSRSKSLRKVGVTSAAQRLTRCGVHFRESRHGPSAARGGEGPSPISRRTRYRGCDDSCHPGIDHGPWA